MAVALPAQIIYTSEIGIHGGGMLFSGDATGIPAQLNGNLGFMYRRVFNQRISMQADFQTTGINGSMQQPFEALYPTTVNIQQKLQMLDLTVAFNFFDYGQLEHVLKSSNQSLYIFAGWGVVQQLHSHSNAPLNISLPYGLGYKVKLDKRLHLNLQWTQRMMFSADGLEGIDYLDNPLGLNGTNRWNNDQIATFTIGMSYGLFRRQCKCINYH